jgi:alpha-tubulin suppressor-like RCC1 family protein
MRRRSIVRALPFWGLAACFSGCGALPQGSSSNDDDYLSETVTLGEARVLPAVADGVSQAATSIRLATDLVGSAPDQAELAIDLSNLAVMVALPQNAISRQPGDSPHNTSAQVTFRFAPANEDACTSDRVVGPFTLTITNGMVSFQPSRMELHRAVRDLLRKGTATVCVQVSADFDGTVSIRRVSFAFGGQAESGEWDEVQICHTPPGEPEEEHTINVGLTALAAHLAHGDQLGPCESGDEPNDADGDAVTDDFDACPHTPSGEVVDPTGCSCSQTDSDADGAADCGDACSDTAAGAAVNVNGCSCGQLDDDADQVSNCDDGCPNTPVGEPPDGTGCSCSQRDGDGDSVDDCADACLDTTTGDEVDAQGCTLIVVAADAGPDTAAIEGDIVSINGSGSVVRGRYDPARLLYRWEQIGGQAVSTRNDLPSFVVDTTGVVGALTFRLTVATDDGGAAASDEVTISISPANIVHLAAGTWHNAILYENNRAFLWGWNRHGEVGDGSIVRDVASIDTGPTFTLLAKTDGTAWVFGTSVLSSSVTPVPISGVDNVVQVAALAEGGIMLRGDGSVWGFVDSDDRSCVLGSVTGGVNGVLGPVAVPGLPGNIVQVASAAQHSVALGADGRAWVWGGPRFGCTPFVALTNVAAVAAGDTHLCLFLVADGTAWAMGYNFYGQLGNGGNVSNYRTPTAAVGMSDVVGVAAGSLHSIFLKRDGSVWTSGWNHDCQLGLGSGVGASVSVARQVSLTDVSIVAGGSSQSAAIQSDNSVWVWGMNNVGQLTGGTATASPGSTVCSPTEIQFP